MTYIIGKNLSPESINDEYKEFRLELIYNNEPFFFKKLFYDNIKLEKLFTEVLYRNFRKYISKYACSFYNSKTYGKLRMGITDVGEIIGIPIRKENLLNIISDVKNIINDELSNIIGNSNVIDNLKHNIKLNIVEVEICNLENFMYPTTQKYLQDRLNEENEYNEYYTKFVQSRFIFQRELLKYRRPLISIANDHIIREELIEYLKSYNVYEDFKDVLSKVIIFLDEDIHKDKYDIKNIIYWIALFRDEKANYVINKYKCTWDYKYKNINSYFRLMQDFKPMISNLIERDFSLYILEIHYPFIKFEGDFLKYKSYKNPENTIFSKRGINTKKEPCCIYQF